MFDEITAMSKFIQVLTPYIEDDLGVLLDENGDETIYPAFHLADNETPDSTLPRVFLTYQGSQNGYTTNRETYQEDNPDHDPEDPDSQEFLYFIRRENHLEWAMTLTAESGSASEVLQNNRSSANTILRKIRLLLARQSVRDELHEEMECGLDYISNDIPARTLDGVVRVDASSLLLNLTALDEDIEQVDGIIDSVNYLGTLYNISEEDPDPIETDRTFEAPDSY